LNLGQLCIGLLRIGSRFAPKSPQDVSSFILSTDFDQPSGRFREEPDSGEKDEKGDDLETNRETPSYWRSAAVDVG